MPSANRPRRGAANKQLDTLASLRRLLRSPVDPERMLKSIASLLAVDVGQYCIVDVVDRRGAVRRLDIQHADASRQARLRVACHDATFPVGGRVARLLERGGSELVARVSDAARTQKLADIVLLRDEPVRSYVAATVSVSGAPMAVLTLVATHGTRRYDDDERAFLETVADWTGLGVENALRREAQPRASVAPPPPGFASDDDPPASQKRVPRRA